MSQINNNNRVYYDTRTNVYYTDYIHNSPPPKNFINPDYNKPSQKSNQKYQQQTFQKSNEKYQHQTFQKSNEKYQHQTFQKSKQSEKPSLNHPLENLFNAIDKYHIDYGINHYNSDSDCYSPIGEICQGGFDIGNSNSASSDAFNCPGLGGCGFGPF
jgi:hypothetical protein